MFSVSPDPGRSTWKGTALLSGTSCPWRVAGKVGEEFQPETFVLLVALPSFPRTSFSCQHDRSGWGSAVIEPKEESKQIRMLLKPGMTLQSLGEILKILLLVEWPANPVCRGWRGFPGHGLMSRLTADQGRPRWFQCASRLENCWIRSVGHVGSWAQ